MEFCSLQLKSSLLSLPLNAHRNPPTTSSSCCQKALSTCTFPLALRPPAITMSASVKSSPYRARNLIRSHSRPAKSSLAMPRRQKHRPFTAAVLSAATIDAAADRAQDEFRRFSGLPPMPPPERGRRGRGRRERAAAERLAVQAAMPPLPPCALADTWCEWGRHDWYVDQRGAAVNGGCVSAACVQPFGVPLCMPH